MKFIEVYQPQKDLGILTINARTGSQRKARKIAKVKGTLGAKPRTLCRYFAPPRVQGGHGKERFQINSVQNQNSPHPVQKVYLHRKEQQIPIRLLPML